MRWRNSFGRLLRLLFPIFDFCRQTSGAPMANNVSIAQLDRFFGLLAFVAAMSEANDIRLALSVVT